MATSYTVLVVERADLVRRTIKRVLAQRGCRVLEAADATGALAVLATPEMRVDLVLIGAVGSLERGELRWEWPQLPQQPQPSTGSKSGRTREPDPIALPSSCTGPPAEAEAALRAERLCEHKDLPPSLPRAPSRHSSEQPLASGRQFPMRPPRPHRNPAAVITFPPSREATISPAAYDGADSRR